VIEIQSGGTTMLRRLLWRISKAGRDARKLMSLMPDQLEGVFNSPEIAQEWQAWAPKLSEVCQIADGRTGGVNVGDRRALFYLARAFAPARVLEIGTHVGASTVHLAAALMAGTRCARLVTVDVEDVNDSVKAVWRRAGLVKSPRQMIQDLSGRIVTRFVIGESQHFFAANNDTFDFVFLDGDHSAETVYEEMVSALAVINEDGLIVLHDYFPDGRPLWSDGVVISGPFAAVEKLRGRSAAVKVIPLGSLPWPTKRNSHMTSLAVIAR
jgi:predicted O-methyltransferase YrrM